MVRKRILTKWKLGRLHTSRKSTMQSLHNAICIYVVGIQQVAPKGIDNTVKASRQAHRKIYRVL